MVKPLSFKGEKKSRKRKAPSGDHELVHSSSQTLELSNRAAATEGDDSWVSAETSSDIIGPIIFVLPSAKPTCIACDANGKVFISELENLFEEDPTTAEPHDVRQVWVASRIAGTLKISFKGYHGRYLSVDKTGILSATNEAVSPEETFTCVESPDTPGTFSVQTGRDNFLAVSDNKVVPEVRGDAESISFNTTIRIRMQGRFKPKLKASKESKAKEKISRKELEEVVGLRLGDDEVKRLKKARVQGNYHEAILDVRVKGKHDKYS